MENFKNIFVPSNSLCRYVHYVWMNEYLSETDFKMRCYNVALFHLYEKLKSNIDTVEYISDRMVLDLAECAGLSYEVFNAGGYTGLYHEFKKVFPEGDDYVLLIHDGEMRCISTKWSVNCFRNDSYSIDHSNNEVSGCCFKEKTSQETVYKLFELLPAYFVYLHSLNDQFHNIYMSCVNRRNKRLKMANLNANMARSWMDDYFQAQSGIIHTCETNKIYCNLTIEMVVEKRQVRMRFLLSNFVEKSEEIKTQLDKMLTFMHEFPYQFSVKRL